MRTALLGILGLAAVSLAGCLGGGENVDQSSTGDPPSGGEAGTAKQGASGAGAAAGNATSAADAAAWKPVTTSIDFGWLASAGTPDPLGEAQIMTTNAGEFSVPAGAAIVTAVAEWTCASPTCDLVLTLYAADGAAQGSGSGSGSTAVEIKDPKPGTWTAQMLTSNPGAAAGVDGTITVTVVPALLRAAAEASEDRGA